MPALKDLTGRKFGRLTVIKRAEDHISANGRKRVFWHCICDCGNECDVNSDSLVKGTTQSCGCLNKELTALRNLGEDLTGKDFYRWHVIKEAPPHISANGNKSRMWHCICQCGNEEDVYGSALIAGTTKSCGCYRDEIIATLNYEDLTGKIFGRWHVIKRVPNYNINNHQVYWECRCDCGTIKPVNANLLKTGKSQSCGCLANELTSKNLSHDLTGMRFNMLTVISKAESKYDKNHQVKTFWNCLCDCGKKCVVSTYYLEHGQYSCGCFKQSKSEKWTEKYLKENDYIYCTQLKFFDLTGIGNKLLSYDFGIYNIQENLIALIECQGQQHYKAVELFGGENQFEVQQFHDELKKEYAENYLQIPLFEIPYWYSEEDIKKLFEPGGEIYNAIYP